MDQDKTHDQDEGIVLAARHVSKSFGAVQVLYDANIEIHAGQVHAIVGENGAGKSTLMKILAGVYQDFTGQLLFQGREMTLANTRMAQQAGIAIIHQELNLIPHLNIAENIFLGREFVNRLGLIDTPRMLSEAKKLLEKLKLPIDPDTPISKLRVGQQQLVEIAKALSLDARVIIMDEPTSAISDHEVEILFELIRALTGQGVAIIYITHKLEEILQISHGITVMRDGHVVGTHRAQDVTQDQIVRLMVGRDIDEFYVKTNATQSTEVLRVENISLAHPVRRQDFLVQDVSFSVRQGEVLGLFGLMGAGRSELLETIFGVHPKTSSGTIHVKDQRVTIDSPQAAIEAGIALVPEDRKLQGLVLDMSVRDSMSLAKIQRVESLGFLNHRLESELTQAYIQRLRIKTTSQHQQVKNLSGGNQQKVVIAKWLATDPQVLLLDEPTRGVDVNAKNEIYKLIGELAQDGLAIVMVSSELPEIMTIADRIIVLSEGRQTAEFTHAEATEESILKAALPRSLVLAS